MNSGEKKEYLLRYQLSEQELCRLEGEIARWRSRAERVTPVLSKVPGGGGGDGRRVERSVEALDGLLAQLGTEWDKLIALRHEIETVIEGVPDDRLRLLLRLRYIDGLTWERVAVEMNYSYMQVCRLHGQALGAIML